MRLDPTNIRRKRTQTQFRHANLESRNVNNYQRKKIRNVTFIPVHLQLVWVAGQKDPMSTFK